MQVGRETCQVGKAGGGGGDTGYSGTRDGCRATQNGPGAWGGAPLETSGRPARGDRRPWGGGGGAGGGPGGQEGLRLLQCPAGRQSLGSARPQPSFNCCFSAPWAVGLTVTRDPSADVTGLSLERVQLACHPELSHSRTRPAPAPPAEG